MPKPDFSARPQAVGYIYQVKYALAKLIASQADAEIVIEGIDDLDIKSNDGVELNQLKHHLSGKGSLTDKSTDLWKSLRVWSQQILSGEIDLDATSFMLITTAEAPDKSAAYYLKEDENTRDPKEALELLKKASSESGNAALKPAFDAFLDLNEADRKQLVRQIYILDSSLKIDELKPVIEKELRYAVDSNRMASLYERLLGWWHEVAVEHLVGNRKEPISNGELRDVIIDISTSIKSKKDLPVDYVGKRPNEKIDPENDNRPFVVQLKEINLPTRRIEYAILDFYRAFQQRSRWTRESLLRYDEIKKYESQLIEEWDRYKLQIEGNKTSKESDQKKIEIGRKLYNWVENEANTRIREKVGVPYVIRGSYHMLANREPPPVYWHPDFLEKVESVLSETN